MKELVSIVVPVYNMGDSLETCVKSILNQDYDKIEIILIDDGSKDNSYEVCCELKNKDERIAIYHTENRGSGPARNYGIEHASGRYIYFPDADDYLSENAISCMVTAVREGEYDLVVFGYRILNQDGRQIKVKQYQDTVRRGEQVRADYSDYMGESSILAIQGAPWNKLFDLKIIQSNAIRYPCLRRHQDEGFIARYMCYSKGICFIPDVLYTHFVNDLQREWQKYPIDYIDVVMGLFEERKKNILVWNSADIKTHDMVYREYVCGVIKALELSLSPKFKFDAKQRRAWQKNAILKSNITKLVIPSIVGKYQRSLIMLFRQGKSNLGYIIMLVKVRMQQIGILNVAKKMIRQ